MARPERGGSGVSERVLVVDGGRGAGQAVSQAAVDVAVGILVDGEGRFLLTTRPPGKVYADYWEFPGGKLEAGETVEQALRRELHEEIGVTIGPAQPWRESLVEYPHGLVHLHFCKVHDWQGELHMREGQRFSWERLPVQCEPVLAGTIPVLAWLKEEAG